MSWTPRVASTNVVTAAIALAALAGRTTPAADIEKALPFVADDYPRALADARAQKLPLFIEAWAPW